MRQSRNVCIADAAASRRSRRVLIRCIVTRSGTLIQLTESRWTRRSQGRRLTELGLHSLRARLTRARLANKSRLTDAHGRVRVIHAHEIRTIFWSAKGWLETVRVGLSTAGHGLWWLVLTFIWLVGLNCNLTGLFRALITRTNTALITRTNAALITRLTHARARLTKAGAAELGLARLTHTRLTFKLTGTRRSAPLWRIQDISKITFWQAITIFGHSTNWLWTLSALGHVRVAKLRRRIRERALACIGIGCKRWRRATLWETTTLTQRWTWDRRWTKTIRARRGLHSSLRALELSLNQRVSTSTKQ